MNYSNDVINKLIEEEISLSNSISVIYHYPDNITHLLYVMLPAFIIKYGMKYKKSIEECLSKVPIIINDKQDKIYQAYYFSHPILKNNSYELSRGIVLNNYNNIGLMQLLDNLIHEFNHAVNSLQNNLLIADNIRVRTGLIYYYFDKNRLSFIKKSEGNILEEIINTRQTEMIVDIIKNLSQYQIQNTIVANTLYSIYHTIDFNYHSNSYLLESTVCKKLLQNKTFLSTIEPLRFQGQIEEIYNFFDFMIRKENSLKKLTNYLEESLKLQKELINRKWFHRFKIQKINNLTQKALDIVEEFNRNTIYK